MILCVLREQGSKVPAHPLLEQSSLTLPCVTAFQLSFT